MYSFAQRKDTTVVDEPLYAHFLKISNAPHPGREEVLASMENDGNKVVRTVILGNYYPAEIIFFKQMTHHLVDIDESFLKDVINIFLIREPKQIISSLAQILSEVTARDIGIQRQTALFEKVSSMGQKPIVVDSGEILKNPEDILTKLCDKLEIPFDKSMLNWNTGPRKEDGVWAKYWYKNVHNTTGFSKQATSSRELPEHLNPLYIESLPFYKKMYEISIRN